MTMSVVMCRAECPWCRTEVLVRAGFPDPLVPEHLEPGTARYCTAECLPMSEAQALADIRDRDGAERFQMRAHP